jgi:hypothetical protein
MPMTDAHGRRVKRLRRGLWLAAVVVAGLVSLVGSGGGFPPCDAPWCHSDPLPPDPAAQVVPPTVTALVGTAVAFDAVGSNFLGTLSHQWSRSTDGATYVDLPGATASRLLLPSVTLADDGARYRVRIRGSGSVGVVREAVGLLAVSSAPGVVFQDGDFALAPWQITPRELPPGVFPAHAETRVATAGNPGAWLSMTFQIPPGAGSASVFHLRPAAQYAPALLGAIHVIDYAEDCRMLQPSETTSAESQLLLVQAGRRYVSTFSNACTDAVWTPVASRNSLKASDFAQIDGPACGAGESCPDFSAGAQPLQFGFRRIVWGAPGDVVGHGIDNWKVTVWRR